MIIYHNPRCRKSRETLEIIKDQGIEPEIVEYLKTPLNVTELKEVLGKLNIKAEDLIRKGESVYKEKYKGKALNEDAWIKAIADNPVLMERPLVVKGMKAVLGRPPENVKELF